MGTSTRMLIFRAKVLTSVLLLLTSLVAGCEGGLALTDSEYVQRAQELIDKGDLKSGAIELKNALQKNPDNAQARWLLGKLYLDINNPAGAEKELTRARELGVVADSVVPSLAKALLMQQKHDEVLALAADGLGSPQTRANLLAIRGMALLSQRKLEEAELEFNAALSVDEKAAYAQLGRGRLAMLRGQEIEARHWLETALATAPKSAEAWEALGDLERSQLKAKEAEIAYTTAIENSRNNWSAHLRRAFTRIHLKDAEGAAKDIGEVKRLVPQHSGAYYAGGLLKLQLEQYTEAQEEFDGALRFAPNFIPAVYYLGVIHHKQGRQEQAKHAFERALSAFPRSARLRKRIGATRLGLGDFEGAVSVLQPVVARNPNDAQALTLLGQAYVKSGDTEQGIKYLHRAAVLQPKAAKGRGLLALGLLQQGEWEEGIAELETAIELDPELQLADISLILSHLQSRQFEEALEAAERFQAKQPANPLPLNLKGMIRQEQGDEAAARAAFEQALELQPADPAAISFLAIMDVAKGDAESARARYIGLLDQRPGHLPTLMQLALLDGRSGRVAEAKAWLEKAIEAHPQALEPRLQLAQYHLRFGQPSLALTLTEEIRDAYPANPRLLVAIGQAQLATGGAASALAAFQQLSKEQPESAEAHYLLAQTYRETKDLANFRGALEKALQADPNHLLSKTAMARLLMLENKPREANQLLQELQKNHGQEALVLELEAWLASRQNRPEDAVRIYQDLLQRFPASEMAIQFADVLGQSGDFDASVQTLVDWLVAHPQDVQVRYRLANTYLFIGQEAAAKDAFAKVLAVAPDNVPALNNLAWLSRTQDPTKALGYAERAYELAPDSIAVMDTLGVILLDQNKAQHALRILRRASERVPDAIAIRYHFARALADSGAEGEARTVLEELLAKRVPFAEEQEARSLLTRLGG